MVVIVSIHQPSTNTLLLFDNVMLLSTGRTVYYGRPADSLRYFTSLGYPPPAMLSPAEYMLQLVNTDFNQRDSTIFKLDALFDSWNASHECMLLNANLITTRGAEEEPQSSIRRGVTGRNLIMQSLTLFHRMIIVLRRLVFC